MNQYKVTITETLKAEINVEDEDYDDAVDKARQMYRNEEIILTADNYYDTDYEAKYLSPVIEKPTAEREER